MNELKDLLKLEDNWNGYNADKFDPEVIKNAEEFLNSLQHTQAFPTARDSIQFEFTHRGIYYEFEVFKDHVKYFSCELGE